MLKTTNLSSVESQHMQVRGAALWRHISRPK